MQQQNAMSMGYHEKYAATLNAHTEQTERDYYVSILGPEIEVLSRFPDQNLELCENILAFCLKSYSEEPHRTRHLACALNTIEVMGRIQFREVLHQYRKGSISLESKDLQNKTYHKLLEKFGKIFI